MKCFEQATDHVWQEKGWPRPPCGQGSAADDSSVAHSLLCKGRMCWDSFRNPPNPLNFTSQLFKSILSGPDDLLTSTYPYCTLPLFGSLFGTNSSTKTDLLDLAQPGVGLLGQIQNQRDIWKAPTTYIVLPSFLFVSSLNQTGWIAAPPFIFPERDMFLFISWHRLPAPLIYGDYSAWPRFYWAKPSLSWTKFLFLLFGDKLQMPYFQWFERKKS